MTANETKNAEREVTEYGTEVITPAVTPAPEIPRRPLRLRQFIAGLCLTTAGAATLLLIAAGAIQRSGIAIGFPLPVVGVVAIIGIMLLGGGFGLMATAAPELDDSEFNRLMRAGDPPTGRFDQMTVQQFDDDQTRDIETDELDESYDETEFSDESDESLNAEDGTDEPAGGRREQGDSDEIQQDAVAGHLAGRQSA